MTRGGEHAHSGTVESRRAKFLRLLGLQSVASRAEIESTIVLESRAWAARTNSPDLQHRKEAVQMIQWLELAERALLKEHVPSADTVPPRRDVSSHSLGVVVDGKNKILLPRNTPIPCEAKHLVFTDADGQTDLTLRVTEGEDEDLEYVTIALEAPLKIPAYRRAAPFEVAFQYDTNGVVRITVLDLTTRKSLGEVQLVRKGTLAEEQVKSGVVELGKETVN